MDQRKPFYNRSESSFISDGAAKEMVDSVSVRLKCVSVAHL